MYRFIDKHNLGEPYIYIHPYRQRDVKELVDKAFEGISYIILFGSSVNDTCKYDSDLDVCVIGDFDEALLKDFRVKGVAMDVLHYKTVDDLKTETYLFNEINKNGVKVYG